MHFGKIFKLLAVVLLMGVLIFTVFQFWIKFLKFWNWCFSSSKCEKPKCEEYGDADDYDPLDEDDDDDDDSGVDMKDEL